MSFVHWRAQATTSYTHARAIVSNSLGSMSQIRALPKGFPRLPACQTILNAIGNLLADRCQVEEFLFILGFFGKLPIHRRLVPKVIIPIHVWHCAEDLS
jgi:hypothetical protein